MANREQLVCYTDSDGKVRYCKLQEANDALSIFGQSPWRYWESEDEFNEFGHEYPFSWCECGTLT